MCPALAGGGVAPRRQLRGVGRRMLRSFAGTILGIAGMAINASMYRSIGDRVMMKTERS